MVLRADAMLPSLQPPDAAAAAVIQDGSMVIVYEGPASVKAVTVDAGKQFQNKFGMFEMKDWVGRPFGCRVNTRGVGRRQPLQQQQQHQPGFVYLLAPTPELWSLALKHRTQILYLADISLVCFYLELAPGAVVLESGTGSGALTHALVRAVAPTGHVHTFEFHAERAAAAAADFEAHGLSACVTVRHRDIEASGFPVEEFAAGPGAPQGGGGVDAVFLDLPSPYKAIPSAAACLRANGMLCSFSPCIEQVQASCEAMECAGFTDLMTIECLLRVHDVRWEAQHVASSATCSGAASGQGAAAQQRQKRQRRDDHDGGGGGRPDDGDEEAEQKQVEPGVVGAGTGAAHDGRHHKKSSAPLPASRILTTRPALEAAGHTGYLTFARKFVAVPRTLATVHGAARDADVPAVDDSGLPGAPGPESSSVPVQAQTS